MTPRSRLYLNPIGLLSGDAASAAIESGMGRRLAGGRFAFTAVEVLRREGHAATTSMATLAEVAAMESAAERLDHLTAPRAAICGIAMDRPAIMGVINVTPDSFSDGGDFAEAESAIAQGRAMAEAGAAIIDVGGESTRPGSDPISEATEIDRVLPVVRALAGHGLTVSIDSRRAINGAALQPREKIKLALP